MFLASCPVYGAIAQCLGRWIPGPWVPRSIPLGGSKIDSAFHPSDVNQMGTRNSRVLSGKLSSGRGSVALIQLNLVHGKVFFIYIKLFKKKKKKKNRTGTQAIPMGVIIRKSFMKIIQRESSMTETNSSMT